MSVKKLHRWYQEVLSGFNEAKESGEIGKYNIKVNERKEVVVPIFEEKNLGKQMAVDEKTINGTCFTILSNRKTNKIALMASSLRTNELMLLIEQFDLEQRMQVKSMSRDMASHYDWFGRQAFMNAYHVVDKFHVIKHVLDQLQIVRIGYRQEELAKQRASRQNNESNTPTIFPNGETTLQLLAKGRGLLFLFPDQWSEHQQERGSILFDNYPEIKKAYQLVLKVRNWLSPPKGDKTYQKTRDKKESQLSDLIHELKQSGIDEMKNIAHMLNRNKGQILNYFRAKETNAKAEALNQNIQRFINVNYGARNTDYFLFRLKKYFS